MFQAGRALVPDIVSYNAVMRACIGANELQRALTVSTEKICRETNSQGGKCCKRDTALSTECPNQPLCTHFRTNNTLRGATLWQLGCPSREFLPILAVCCQFPCLRHITVFQSRSILPFPPALCLLWFSQRKRLYKVSPFVNCIQRP